MSGIKGFVFHHGHVQRSRVIGHYLDTGTSPG